MNTLDTNAQNIDNDFLEPETEVVDIGVQIVSDNNASIVQTNQNDYDDFDEVTFTYRFNIEDFSFLNHTELPAKKYMPVKVSDLPSGHPYRGFAKAIGLLDDQMIALAQLKQTEIAGSVYSTLSNIYSPQIQRSLDDGELMVGDLKLKDLMGLKDVVISPYFGLSQERNIGSGVVTVPSLNVTFTVPLVIVAKKTVYNMVFHVGVKVNPEHEDLETALQQLSLKLSRKQYPKDLTPVDYAVDVPKSFSHLKQGVYYIRECTIIDAKAKDGKAFKSVKCKCYDEVTKKFFDLGLAGGAATMLKSSPSLIDESNGAGLLLDFKGFDAKGSISHVLVIPKPLYSKFSDAIPKEYQSTSDSNPFADMGKEYYFTDDTD